MLHCLHVHLLEIASTYSMDIALRREDVRKNGLAPPCIQRSPSQRVFNDTQTHARALSSEGLSSYVRRKSADPGGQEGVRRVSEGCRQNADFRPRKRFGSCVFHPLFTCAYKASDRADGQEQDD